MSCLQADLSSVMPGFMSEVEEPGLDEEGAGSVSMTFPHNNSPVFYINI